MKTKYKVLALVEITIVLCSVFLVAISGIAANQTTQEVSANTITTASEEDYVLGVYGNANEDDTIDMRDLTYVKLIFFGKKPETELADAKYDGKINPLDFIQIKLIIVGKEKELTVNIYTRPSMGSTDITEVPVTVHKPIERIVPTIGYHVVTVRALKLDKDRIAGVTEDAKEANAYFPEFSGLPSVGKSWTQDYEAVLNLHPDLVIMACQKFEKDAEKLPGVTVVAFDCWRPDTYVDEIRRLGYILDKEDEAEKFIDFYSGVMNTVKETVDKIPEGNRPKVYFESRKPYSTGAKGSGYHAKVTTAGGNNIFSDLSGYPQVDPEEVIKRNPEIIVKYPRVTGSSYYIGTDVTELIDIRSEILNRPELAKIEAVKNGKVYILHGDVIGATRHFMGIGYMAKWFQPELFKDLDLKAIHQEYITRFQGLPDDFLDTHGVFVYPEEPV